MTERAERILSWACTVACGLYVAWMAHHLATIVPSMKQMFDDLGAELPRVTQLVLRAAGRPTWIAAGLLVSLLAAKEILVKRHGVRLALTLLVFIAAAWSHALVTNAMMRPWVDMLRHIN